MLTLLLGAWKPIAAIVGVALFAIAVIAWKHNYDEGKRTEGRAEIKLLWDADRAHRIQAVTDQTMLWNDKRIEAEKLEQELSNERSKRTELAAVAAKNLPPAVARVVVPAAARRVLNDAIAAHNSAAVATAPAKSVQAAPAAAADTDLGKLTQWGVEVIAVCGEYRDRALGLIAFYEALRLAQPKETP